MAFKFTPNMTTVSNDLWAVTSAVGAGLCFIVLLVTGAVWCHRPSRNALDRVSFRLVVYALVANTWFGISSAIGGMLTGPGFLCGFSIFILQLTLQMSSFLLFSIALNLLLVVVYNKDGQRLEKFYVAGSIIAAIVLTVPPYAAGQYGWDPLESDCWYTNDNKKQRLAWQIGTQMIWTAFTVIGEIIASICVMIFMLRHQMRRRQVYASTASLSNNKISNANSVVLRTNNYKLIILRIALYPLASCLVNLLSIFTALHSTIADGIHNPTDYHILLLSDFLYGGRAVVYALLAASDPALIRGVKSLASSLYGRNTSTPGPQTDKETTGEVSTVSGHVVVHVELSTFQDHSSRTNVNHISKDDRSSSAVNLPPHEAKGHVEFAEAEPPRELGPLRPQFASAAEDARLSMMKERERESDEAFGRKI